jgi:hypothetical protein
LDAYRCSSTFHPTSLSSTFEKWALGFPLRRSLLGCLSFLIDISSNISLVYIGKMGAWVPSQSLSTWMPIVAHRHSSAVLLLYIGKMGAWVLSVALYLDALFVAIHPSSLVVYIAKKGYAKTRTLI